MAKYAVLPPAFSASGKQVLFIKLFLKSFYLCLFNFFEKKRKLKTSNFTSNFPIFCLTIVVGTLMNYNVLLNYLSGANRQKAEIE